MSTVDFVFFFFSDEKVFSVASPVNLQNDRVYAPSNAKLRDIAAERMLRCRPTFSSSLMVSVAVSKLGCMELFFVEPGVKVDGRYYREILLKKQMLPVMRHIAGDTYVFQQHSAPVHRARETVQLLQQETSQFICPDLWPPNSLDLNSVDYWIWGYVQERVYKTLVRDTNDLKQRLIDWVKRYNFRG